MNDAAAPVPLRKIIHIDMDAFFASVEALESPELRGVPLIVGGDGARGVVASCSYEARFYGVRSAMPSTRAKRLCPRAVFVSGRYHLYEAYSRQMHQVLQSFTPLVEELSLDEAFLDVSGARRLFGSSEEIAWSIKNRLQDELGLPASVGVATTKHVAKLASVAAKPKASRNGAVDGKGVVVVTAEEAIGFLHALPVRALWGVGPKAGERLAKIGIESVAQLATMPVEQLALAVGNSQARHLNDLAWNRDQREVETGRETKSVGHEQTYAADLRERQQMHDQFVRLADAVAARLRKSHHAGRTLTVKVRFGSFQTITRSRTLPMATANASTLVAVADDLTEAVDVGPGVRLLGLSVSNLEPYLPAEQLSLEGGGTGDDSRLDDAIDRIRERYGEEAVVPAPLVTPEGAKVMRRGDQQWGPSTKPRNSGDNS